MELGSAAVSTGAEWIGRAPHEDLRRKIRPAAARQGPVLRPACWGSNTPGPAPCCARRDVELAFLGLVPQKLTATQLLYRSTDLNGLPQAAVTTVVVPADRAAAAAGPILSYQCAIDAVAGSCFPSYALRRGAKAVGALAQFEFLLVAAALAEGWAVSIPDHEGPTGSGVPRREPGYHVLDGLRAALNARGAQPVARDAPIGLWGYSGGGLATAWATEVHADYAPELNVVGAVLGSPVGDLGHTFRRLNGSFFSGLPALVVAALSHVYPDLDRVINEHVTVEGKAMLPDIQRDDDRARRHRADPQGHGHDMVDEPLEKHPATARGPARLRQHQARHRGAEHPRAHRTGRARPHRLRRGHRRTDRDLLQHRRHRRHLSPRHVQRAHAAAPAVGADDAALAA